jgi:hypothetical protein
MTSLREGLVSLSKFSSHPSGKYYLHIRRGHRSPTPHYTSTRFGPLRPTGESTGHRTMMRHKTSFSMLLHLTKASFVRLITQIISWTRSGSCWVICSRDGQAPISTLRCRSLRISDMRTVVDTESRRRLSSPGYAHRIYRDRALPHSRDSIIFIPLQICVS